jgi:hypothetical protein
MGIAWDWRTYNGYQWLGARIKAERDGTRWRLEVIPGLDEWYTMEGRSFWGPFRWRRSDWWDHSYAPIVLRGVSVRCWAVMTAALAWPLVGLALRVRRRRRLRQLALAGCCRQCGYDLRATPEPSGVLLGRCPECGLVPEASVPGA